MLLILFKENGVQIK